MREYDLIIIGGGAAGLLSAINGKKDGIKNILLVEKDPILGGALNSADYNISEKGNLTGIEYKENLLKADWSDISDLYYYIDNYSYSSYCLFFSNRSIYI